MTSNQILSDKERGISVKSSKDYINLSRKGLKFGQMNEILKFCGLSIKQISKIVSISERQFARYSENTILKRNASAQLIQILELYKFGYNVFEKKSNFQKWMNSDIRALNYQKPIDLLDTPFGINEVKTILGRIEYGVYS